MGAGIGCRRFGRFSPKKNLERPLGGGGGAKGCCGLQAGMQGELLCHVPVRTHTRPHKHLSSGELPGRTWVYQAGAGPAGATGENGRCEWYLLGREWQHKGVRRLNAAKAHRCRGSHGHCRRWVLLIHAISCWARPVPPCTTLTLTDPFFFSLPVPCPGAATQFLGTSCSTGLAVTFGHLCKFFFLHLLRVFCRKVGPIPVGTIACEYCTLRPALLNEASQAWISWTWNRGFPLLACDTLDTKSVSVPKSQGERWPTW